MDIQKETPIHQILAGHPRAIGFFRNREMGCAHCYAVNFETLEKGAMMHGLDADRLVRELREFLAGPPHPSPTADLNT